MRRITTHSVAFAAFVAVSIAIAWPLPLHLGTRLLGSPGHDTGVYLWNMWVFHYEASHGRYPWSTDRLFSLSEPADLSLHNYSTFADALAYPIIGTVGVVAAYNIVMIALVALNGYAVFLLARRFTESAVHAWLGGALFAVSPVIVARSTAHASLVAAAPIAFFTIFLLRFLDHGRPRDAGAAGAAVAWATFGDAYFGIYCVLIALVVLAPRLVSLGATGNWRWRPAGALWVVDLLLLVLAAVVVGVAVHGGGVYEIAGLRVSLLRLYTPMLLLTVLVLVRLAVVFRPRLRLHPRPAWRAPLQFAIAATAAALVLLSPMLVALGDRVISGRFANPPMYWRSSPPGVDLASFVVPNPNHPLLRDWIDGWPNGSRGDLFAELTASVSLVALVTIAMAWRMGGPLPRLWMALAAVFGALALGPFLHVAGVNTYVPGPWALLRYVPLVNLARSPSRFVIVVSMAVAVLFAAALGVLRQRGGRWRTLAVPLVVACLVVEAWPVPRPLYSAEISRVYRTIAADPDPRIRVLELPTGIRDGTSSLGNFSARTMFHQTVHGKRLLGGYLSRVSERRKTTYRLLPVMDALFTLSAGQPLTPDQAARAWAVRDRFVASACIGYVVVDRTRGASDALRQFAIALLDLEKIDDDSAYELYRPRHRACGPAGRDKPRRDEALPQGARDLWRSASEAGRLCRVAPAAPPKATVRIRRGIARPAESGSRDSAGE